MHQITRVISYQIKNRLPFLYIPGIENHEAVFIRVALQEKVKINS